MMWRHRIARAYWLHVRLKRYPLYAGNLGPDAECGFRVHRAQCSDLIVRSIPT